MSISRLAKQVIKAANPGSLHQPSTDVRHPMYELGDKIGELRISVVQEPTMKADQVLGGLLQGLRDASDAVRGHLDANYLWD